jgi:hypothetical protein
MAMNWTRGEFSITCDPDKQDVEVIHGFLSRSYWSKGIPEDTVKRSMDGSLCFDLLHKGWKVGFARVIFYFAIFAFLGEVFVLE